ncbi:Xaa-Pro peptidase family protein [Devosia sp. ZB163]|uniref:M24 family metallopeptidase n=1 Tax=Devosia sp. ZB163 TaxID=3025938 RepID=UPI00235DE8BD|nr:Xaa-Pro peptidase family protein [Devosia sp. ZB163]MDC9825058.1 Xaa-Pro peptidase family protein [Devosia sp. ZB163]
MQQKLMEESRTSLGVSPPFDPEFLDGLMEVAGLDVLIVTSRHNVQYMLGGYRFFMFDYMDAIGLSRYLPIFVYHRGHPAESAYIGNTHEAFEQELGRFWVANVQATSRTSADAMQLCIEHLRRIGLPSRRIGIEAGFLPADAYLVLRDATEGSEIVDAVVTLERLRAVKTQAELALLRHASESVVDAMLTVFSELRPGRTKSNVVEALRREETTRGLMFEYCLLTAGRSFNRAPSDQVLRDGDIMSLDSGGNYRGYIGDHCRMGILGEPDAELDDLLGQIEEVQQAARKPLLAGAIGGDIYAAVEPFLARLTAGKASFVAHGMGLISHEAPRLTADSPWPYSAYDRERPLAAGMVISIETTLQHPSRGYIKLEDTLAITASGYEAFGDRGRGWNRAAIAGQRKSGQGEQRTG